MNKKEQLEKILEELRFIASCGDSRKEDVQDYVDEIDQLDQPNKLSAEEFIEANFKSGFIFSPDGIPQWQEPTVCEMMEQYATYKNQQP